MVLRQAPHQNLGAQNVTEMFRVKARGLLNGRERTRGRSNRVVALLVKRRQWILNERESCVEADHNDSVAAILVLWALGLVSGLAKWSMCGISGSD